MNPQDQIKALAELDGWEGVRNDVDCWHRWMGVCPRRKGMGRFEVPHYPTSYDAIIPLVQKQSRQTKIKIIYLLKEMGVELVIDATPAQLCEALLRATSKWKD